MAKGRPVPSRIIVWTLCRYLEFRYTQGAAAQPAERTSNTDMDLGGFHTTAALVEAQHAANQDFANAATAAAAQASAAARHAIETGRNSAAPLEASLPIAGVAPLLRWLGTVKEVTAKPAADEPTPTRPTRLKNMRECVPLAAWWDALLAAQVIVIDEVAAFARPGPAATEWDNATAVGEARHAIVGSYVAGLAVATLPGRRFLERNPGAFPVRGLVADLLHPMAAQAAATLAKPPFPLPLGPAENDESPYAEQYRGARAEFLDRLVHDGVLIGAVTGSSQRHTAEPALWPGQHRPSHLSWTPHTGKIV